MKIFNKRGELPFFLGMLLFVWLCGVVSAQATEGATSYTLPDLNLEMKIPNSYIVQVRGSDEMPGNDVYLVAGKESYEIRMRVGSNDAIREVGNLTECSEEEKVAYSKSVVDAINTTGVYKVINWRLEDIQGVSFVRLDIESSQDTLEDYGIEYYTIANGQRIIYSLHNYAHPIGSEQQDVIAKVVENSSVAEWAGVRMGAETEMSTRIFLAENLQVALQLPESWQETTEAGKYVNDKHEYIFVSCQDQGEDAIQILADSLLEENESENPRSLISFLCSDGTQNLVATFIGDKKGKGHEDFLHMAENLSAYQSQNNSNAPYSPTMQKILSLLLGQNELPNRVGAWIAFIGFYLFFYVLIFVVLRFIAGQADLISGLKLVIPYTLLTCAFQTLFAIFLHMPSPGLAVLICAALDLVILCFGASPDMEMIEEEEQLQDM